MRNLLVSELKLACECHSWSLVASSRIILFLLTDQIFINPTVGLILKEPEDSYFVLLIYFYF